MIAVEQKMKRLLESERAILLEGNLDALSEIAKQKEALIPDMRSLPQSAHADIRAGAEKNHALLGAAMRGLRGAIRRINAISGANAPLQTYSATGVRSALDQGRKRDFESRA